MGAEESRGSDIGRTLRMLAAMMRGEVLDKHAAAECAGINPDSAPRNLRHLVEHIPGVVVETNGRRHVYRFDPSHLAGVDVPDEKVGVAGAITMSLAAAFGRVFTGSTYGAEFVRLRNSVVQRLAEFRKQQFADMTRKFVVIGGREELLEDKEALLDQLLDALLRERLLRIRYENFDGVAKQRVVEPYSLAVYDSHLYLFARDVDDRASGVRMFRFARLRSAQALSETFAYPSPNEYDPEVLLRDSIGIWLGQDEPCTVRVRLSSGWAVFARHHRWHDSQRLVRELEDGSVELVRISAIVISRLGHRDHARGREVGAERRGLSMLSCCSWS